MDSMEMTEGKLARKSHRFDDVFVVRSDRAVEGWFGLGRAEWAVLISFVVLTVITVWRHEPWADEAQAWLIARDLSLKQIFWQVKYEGSPPLWHLLLWCAIRVHIPYAGIGLISAAVSTATVYLLLRFAPFPRAIRYLLPFTFHLQFQNSVVARSYCLTILLGVAAVACWRERPRRFLLVSPLLALLCQTNAYGFGMAGALSAVFLFDLARCHASEGLNPFTRLKNLAGILLVIGSACLAMFLTKSPPDLSSQGTAKLWVFPRQFWWMLYERRCELALEGAFGPLWFITVVLLILLGWVQITGRRVALLPFIAVWQVCVLVYFKPWHIGLLFFSFILTVWLAWSVDEKVANGRFTRALVVGTVALCCLQVVGDATSVYRDIRWKYSGAQQTAEYLKSEADGRRKFYGVDYGTVAILPYFERNIFVNQHSHSYFAWSIFDSPREVAMVTHFEGPSTVVIAATSASMREVTGFRYRLLQQGFRNTHQFCGSMFVETGVFEESCFDIYERN